MSAIKETIMEYVILKQPWLKQCYAVRCDATIRGLPSVLGREGIVSLTNRLLKSAEAVYTTELELLALVFSMEQFRPYILRTSLRKCKNTSARLRRWAFSFEFNIVHIKGTENVAADYLSRNIAGKKDKSFEEVAIVAV